MVRFLPHQAHRRLDEGADIEPILAELGQSGLDPGDIEDIVDKAQEVRAALVNVALRVCRRSTAK